MKSLVQITNLTHRYDKRTTAGVKNINFNILNNECLALIGPSGSGKSTTLKLISNILDKEQGEIKFDADVSIQYVPQTTTINEDETVFDFLKAQLIDEIPEENIENQVRTTLATLELTNEIHSPIKHISGGQRQRVIIAKALVKNPTLILLDEPFGHLDQMLRFDLIQELFSIFKENNITTVWVTHEVSEALAFSDRIAVLNYGTVLQVDTPENIYHHPSSYFAAHFLGQTNTIATSLINEDSDTLTVKLFNREVIIPKPLTYNGSKHGDILLIIRPEHIEISENGYIKGEVTQIIFKGDSYINQVKIGADKQLWVSSPNDLKPIIGSKVRLQVSLNNIHCLGEI